MRAVLCLANTLPGKGSEANSYYKKLAWQYKEKLISAKQMTSQFRYLPFGE